MRQFVQLQIESEYIGVAAEPLAFALSELWEGRLSLLSISAAALLTSASICFAFSDAGGDCCAFVGLTIAIATSATQTKIGLSIDLFS